MSSKYDTETDWISGEQTVFVGQNKWGIQGPGFEKQALAWSLSPFLEPNFLQLDRKEQMKVGKYYKLIFIMFENILQGP